MLTEDHAATALAFLNFYHNDMTDYELNVLRPRVHDFVNRVLSLLG